MKIKLLPSLIAAVGFLSAPFALAASYQSELSAAYAELDANDNDEQGYFVGLEGKYYFAPVETANHPLAEAAFMEKSSNLYVNLGNIETKEAGDRFDIYSRSIAVDFYIPNSLLFLGAGVDEVKSKYTWPTDDNFNAGSMSSRWDSTWFVKAGIAPVTGLLIWSEFSEDVDLSEQWNINGKYIVPLSGEQALNIEASYQNSEFDGAPDTITAAVDYYLDRNLSIGGGFINSAFDEATLGDDSANDYFIRARNYFTDNASLELSYTEGEYENSLALGGTLRF